LSASRVGRRGAGSSERPRLAARYSRAAPRPGRRARLADIHPTPPPRLPPSALSPSSG